MKRFSTAELARRSGDVLHEAAKFPIALTRHEKARFVLMSVEFYEHMRMAGKGEGEHGIDLPEVPGVNNPVGTSIE